MTAPVVVAIKQAVVFTLVPETSVSTVILEAPFASGSSGSGGGTAATTTFTPAGTIAATDVQAALVEVSGDVTTEAAARAAADALLLVKTANLSDVASAATARTNLAISATNTPFTPNGSIAATNVQAAIQEVRDEAGAGSGDALTTNPLSQFAATTSAQLRGVLSDETGTGAAVFATSPAITTPTGIVKGDVGLGSVDNTADTAKPVSTAQQTALNLKANLASPTFTGTVTIPTGGSITAPTGLVKGDVGLGNVDNTSDANKPVSTAQATADDLRNLKSANLSDVASAATARTNLGLAIGTNVQAYDADLTTYAGITPTAWAQARLIDANQAANLSALGLTAAGLLSRLVAGMTVPPNSLDRWKAGPGLPAAQVAGAMTNSVAYVALIDPSIIPDATVKGIIKIDDEEVFTTSGTAARTVTDGVLNTTTTVTSATAAFVSGDIGKRLVGTGIPRNAYITAVGSGTSITISIAATATATGVTLTVGRSANIERGVNGTTAATHATLAEAMTAIHRTVVHLGDSVAEGVNSSLIEAGDGWSVRAARVIAKGLGGLIGAGWGLWRSTAVAQSHQEFVFAGSWFTATATGATNAEVGWDGASTATGSSNTITWTRPAGQRVAGFDVHWVDLGTASCAWSISIDGGSTWVDNPASTTTWTSGAGKLRRYRWETVGGVVVDNPTDIRIRAANAAGTSKTVYLPNAFLYTHSTPIVRGVTEGVRWCNFGKAGAKLRLVLNSRTFTDAVVTNGSPTVTSATAAFVAADAGSTVYLSGVAYTISTRDSATQITLTGNYAGTTGTAKRITIFQGDNTGDRMASFLGHHGSLFPDLVIIGPFNNDEAGTTNGDGNPDAMTDMCQYLYTKISPVADILYIAPYESGGAVSTGLQGQYRDAIEAVAAANNAASLNLYAAFSAYGYTGYTAVNAGGYMDDTIHMSAKGNRWIGSTLARTLEVV